MLFIWKKIDVQKKKGDNIWSCPHVPVIRIRKSKDRQHNDQKKKDQRTNTDQQNMYIKLKVEYHEPQ